MIVSNLKGGLGNYLFQLAACYSLAIDNNTLLKVDINRIHAVHSHWTTYTSNIFRKICIEKDILTNNTYRYESLVYKPIPYSRDILVDGYYQSEKYFVHNKEKILELFLIDDETRNYILLQYRKILESENTCSIHVRRGDYVWTDLFRNLSMQNYYQKSIELMGRDKLFVIFSDDIEWCKEAFTGLDAVFIEGEQDYVDLYLMSLCKNNITANSSFSWWGAYLNNNPLKMVITPKDWYMHTYSDADVVPPSWVRIDTEHK